MPTNESMNVSGQAYKSVSLAHVMPKCSRLKLALFKWLRALLKCTSGHGQVKISAFKEYLQNVRSLCASLPLELMCTCLSSPKGSVVCAHAEWWVIAA